MGIQRLIYKPEDGWRSDEAFPDDYSSTESVRNALQELFDQIKEYVNIKLLPALELESGADQIGARAMSPGDNSGATVMQKLVALKESITSVAHDSVPDEAVSTEKIQEGAVTLSKLHSSVQAAITGGGKCKQTGGNTFNSTSGRVIPLSPAMVNANFTVMITPSGNTGYTVGEIWVSEKTTTSFKVFCSGTNTTSPFDYAVFVN